MQVDTYIQKRMQVFTYRIPFCENPPVTVFDPNRKRNARGEQRRQALLRAAAAVFGRLGYHQTTTNAIAKEAGVSPATLYQFFPNKEAIASALASMYAREMADAERAIDSEGVLSFKEAVRELIDVCISFNRKRPEFHTLVVDAPLSPSAREDKQVLGQVFVDFIAARLRRELPTLSSLRSDPPWAGSPYDLPRNPRRADCSFASRPSAPAAGDAQCHSSLFDPCTHGIENGRLS